MSKQPFGSTTTTGREKALRVPDRRWSILVETAAFSGLQAGELAALQVREFDSARATLSISRSLPTKGRVLGRPKSAAGLRDVDGLDPGLCDQLRGLAKGKRATDYLFGYVDDGGVSHPYNHLNFYRRHFQPACEDLGIAMRFHDLRHFFASLLLSEGEDLLNVSRLLGHASASFTVDTYGHVMPREANGRGARVAARRAVARGEERGVRKPAPKRTTARKPF